MANHKKRKHPRARAHCSLCKPWKDGGISRLGAEFEKWSDHRRRVLTETKENDD